MSFSNDPGPFLFTQRVTSAPEAHPLADPHLGQDDHLSELPAGKPRNALGDAATVGALVGVVLVWALQDSIFLVGFIVSGIAFVAGVAALFLRGRRRATALAGVLIGAFPFLFTLARFIWHF